MKYVNEFRNGDAARVLAEKIAREVHPERQYRLMEFCGGHTHTIFRYGIPDLLPANVQMMHGPGCPVCVLPMKRIDAAIELAMKHNVILCSYGDMLRVPGSHRMSLQKAKGQGADIRMLYSPADALEIARQCPDREVVFFAIGFETTTPPTAVILQQADQMGLKNFSVFCNHVMTPPAIRGILEPARQSGQTILEGLVGPGHVSLIIGANPYQDLVKDYQLPIVISGFEPLDLLHSILMLIQQVNAGSRMVENQYTRAVTDSGNQKAQAMIEECFEVRESFEWRGLGELPNSALRIREAFAHLDAERRYSLTESIGQDNKACECPAVLRGAKKPTDCKLFGTSCTPENPIGSCMVSSEGACAAYYTYRSRAIPAKSFSVNSLSKEV
ncbi:hydrogenase formation protein HypD [Hahella sp. CCB-MM4]|uniref:hydrogenase formation protein HypD n=1 Tax=Hahella sp. (strain CCB-MM4) TaxID=1926491 RepID=UPI000B9C2B1F|nr:hydrogenase formation protein HypD [Hahella sp. CCB-MM4]OZG72919.1 hydrogenase formation protein HypD [Hahella sp. CCB-MM4]